MDFLLEAMREAFKLLFRLDPEFLHIVGVSLKVSAASILFATLIGVPLGFLVGRGRFPGRKTVSTLLNTLMALPTVVVGLFVFSLIARQGPLGSLGLLYTPWAMIFGQTVLASPIIAALTLAAVEGADPRIADTALTLGASRTRVGWAVLAESRLALLAALTAGFGRIFAEVGVSMMLGGNIRWYTRNITTTIALESSMGEFAMGLALGLVLLLVAFGLNLTVQLLRTRPDA
ncbi:MAG: ABC transporter permease [Planctomycetota bacterium]|jgi:tungstate transport system permease protein